MSFPIFRIYFHSVAVKRNPDNEKLLQNSEIIKSRETNQKNILFFILYIRIL